MITPDSGLVTLNGVGTHPVIDLVAVLPAFDGVVVAAGEEQVVRVPLYELNILLMLTEHTAAVKLHIFIHLPYPNCLVSAAGCQIQTIVGPGYTLYFVFMSIRIQSGNLRDCRGGLGTSN